MCTFDILSLQNPAQNKLWVSKGLRKALSAESINSSTPIVMLFMLAAYTINYNEKIYQVMLYCAYDNAALVANYNVKGVVIMV